MNKLGTQYAEVKAELEKTSGSDIVVANADKVDGCDAGTAPDNVLKLDSGGKVPISAFPGLGAYFNAATDPYGGLIILSRNETHTDNGEWRTVGPTGSDATVIWAALDAVPAGAKAVLLSLMAEAVHGTEAAATHLIDVKFRKNGSDIIPVHAVCAQADLAGERSYGHNTVIVGVDAARIFQFWWNKTAVSDGSLLLNICLEGWYA